MVPLFLPFPIDEPVSRTPIQSSPVAKNTGPRCITTPKRESFVVISMASYSSMGRRWRNKIEWRGWWWREGGEREVSQHAKLVTPKLFL